MGKHGIWTLPSKKKCKHCGRFNTYDINHMIVTTDDVVASFEMARDFLDTIIKQMKPTFEKEEEK